MRTWAALTMTLGLTLCMGPTSGKKDDVNMELAVDKVINRLLGETGGQNRTGDPGSGLVVLPPTFSVDVWSLLKVAVRQEIMEQREGATGGSGRNARYLGNSVAKEAKTFPIEQLDLVDLDGKKYFFSKKQKLSWIEASNFCRMYGMELVSIETEKEDRLVNDHMYKIGIGGQVVTYTSGNKIGRSTYMWLNGSPLIYENWRSGQPAQPATEHCLVYWEKDWHDFHCTGHESYFICEE